MKILADFHIFSSEPTIKPVRAAARLGRKDIGVVRRTARHERISTERTT